MRQQEFPRSLTRSWSLVPTLDPCGVGASRQLPSRRSRRRPLSARSRWVRASGSAPAEAADALALYDDNGNGRITCAEARARHRARTARAPGVLLHAGRGRGCVRVAGRMSEPASLLSPLAAPCRPARGYRLLDLGDQRLQSKDYPHGRSTTHPLAPRRAAVLKERQVLMELWGCYVMDRPLPESIARCGLSKLDPWPGGRSQQPDRV